LSAKLSAYSALKTRYYFGDSVSCTKAQLLSIILYIEKELQESKDKEEALRRIRVLRERIEMMNIEEVVKQFSLYS